MNLAEITAEPFAWPVAAYFALASVGTGAAITASLGALGGAPIRARLLLIAGLLVAVSTLFLILDLAAPGRFLNVLTHFNPDSAIAWGTRAVALFLITTGLAWVLLRDQPADVRPGLGVMLLLVAVLLLGAYVAWYPGWVLSQAAARPVWHGPFIGLLFLASAAHIALALSHALRGLRWEIALTGIQAILMTAYLIGLSVGVDHILTGRLAVLFWLGVVGVGWLLPVWLVANNRSASLRIASVILGAASLRLLILQAGQGGSVFYAGA